MCKLFTGFVLFFTAFSAYETNTVTKNGFQSSSENTWMKLFVNCDQEKTQCYKEKIILMTNYTTLKESNAKINGSLQNCERSKDFLVRNILMLVAPLVTREKVDGLKSTIFHERQIATHWLELLNKEKREVSPNKIDSSSTTGNIVLTPEMRATAEKLQHAEDSLHSKYSNVQSTMDKVLSEYGVEDKKKAWLKDRMQGSVAEWFIAFEISRSSAIEKLKGLNCDPLQLSIHLAYISENASDDAHKLGTTLVIQMQFTDSDIVNAMLRKTYDQNDECLKSLLQFFFPNNEVTPKTILTA